MKKYKLFRGVAESEPPYEPVDTQIEQDGSNGLEDAAQDHKQETVLAESRCERKRNSELFEAGKGDGADDQNAGIAEILKAALYGG